MFNVTRRLIDVDMKLAILFALGLVALPARAAGDNRQTLAGAYRRACNKLERVTRAGNLERTNVGALGRQNAVRDDQLQGERVWPQPKPLSGR